MRSVVIVVALVGCGSSSSSPPGGSGSGTPRCESDLDCVLACDFTDDDCCKLWSCERVEHKEVAPGAAAFRSTCMARNYECVDDKPRTHTLRPRCLDGRCVGEKIPVKN